MLTTKTLVISRQEAIESHQIDSIGLPPTGSNARGRPRNSESSERSSSYPPYNIRKDGNHFAIEIAVAGLSKEDINIELADGVLSVSYDGPGTEVVNDNNEVVYQGIAQRAFRQQFTLSNDVVVQGADLINGLLTINLEKIIPDEKKPRTIEIKTPKRILG